MCVRLFLEKYDNDVKAFCEEFRQLTMVDEKYDLLMNFLQSLYAMMRPETMWQGKKRNLYSKYKIFNQNIDTKIETYVKYGFLFVSAVLIINSVFIVMYLHIKILF